MELDIDLPAWLCYAFVFAISLYSAVGEVDTRLKDVRGRWAYGETYALFLLFVTLPVLVFWLLDRTNAIRDTSLFATILVALGYQAIIKGTSATKNASVSAIGKPVLDWSDRIVEKLANHLKRIDAEFATTALDFIGRTPDVGADGKPQGRSVAEKSKAFVAWARTHVKDQVTFDERMEEYAAGNPEQAAQTEAARRKWHVERARRALLFVTPSGRVRWQLWRARLLRGSNLLGFALSPERLTRVLLPTALLVFLVASGANWLGAQVSVGYVQRDLGLGGAVGESPPSTYYQWRFLKTRNSETDIERAVSFFARKLECQFALPTNPDPDHCRPAVERSDRRPGWLSRARSAIFGTKEDGMGAAVDARRRQPEPVGQLLVAMLKHPTLTPEQAGRLLRILLEGRLRDRNSACPVLRLLPEATRTSNLEVRTIVENTISGSLSLLAPADAQAVPAPQASPEGALIPDVEKRVRRWSALVDETCPPPKTDV